MSVNGPCPHYPLVLAPLVNEGSAGHRDKEREGAEWGGGVGNNIKVGFSQAPLEEALLEKGKRVWDSLKNWFTIPALFSSAVSPNKHASESSDLNGKVSALLQAGPPVSPVLWDRKLSGLRQGHLGCPSPIVPLGRDDRAAPRKPSTCRTEV